MFSLVEVSISNGVSPISALKLILSRTSSFKSTPSKQFRRVSDLLINIRPFRMLTGLQSVHGFLLDVWIKSPRRLRSISVYLNMLADERNKVQLYDTAPSSAQFSTFSAEFLGWSSSFSHLWLCTTSRRRDGFSPLCPWLPGEPAKLFFGWTASRLLFRQETRKRSKYIHARKRKRDSEDTRSEESS